MEQDKQSYYPLNLANMQLLKLCTILIEGANEIDTSKSEVSQRLVANHQKWLNLHQTVGPYDSFKIASEIACDLKYLDINFINEVKNRPEILEAFINVPLVIKNFFHFHFLVNDLELFDRLSEIAIFLRDDPELAYCVRELTVYVEQLKDQTSMVNYRLVKLKFVPELVNIKTHIVLQRTANWFVNHYIGRSITLSSDLNLYADRLAPNFYISQGNANYKKYLDLLGIIDKVYDKQRNFAYVV
jgi:hypothetical protein